MKSLPTYLVIFLDKFLDMEMLAERYAECYAFEWVKVLRG